VTATYVIDTTMGWSLRRSTQRLDYPGWTDEIQNEYHVSKNANGIPLLERIEYRAKTTAKGKVTFDDKGTWTHRSTYDTNVPDDEFKLTAFGLPEPVDVPPAQKAGSRMWLWLLLAACSFAAIGLVLRLGANRLHSRNTKGAL
jgi:hypothetical protein